MNNVIPKFSFLRRKHFWHRLFDYEMCGNECAKLPLRLARQVFPCCVEFFRFDPSICRENSYTEFLETLEGGGKGGHCLSKILIIDRCESEFEQLFVPRRR